MSNAFMGEMRWVSFNFAPKGWTLCNGQFMPINQNQALFSLLGTMYGGNGQTTFALPNLQGQTGIHVGQGYIQGQAGGQVNHTLIQSEMPQHTHQLNCSNDVGTDADPTNKFFGNTGGAFLYGGVSNPTTINPAAVSTVGGNQPHDNMQPYLVLACIICLSGIFPSQN